MATEESDLTTEWLRTIGDRVRQVQEHRNLNDSEFGRLVAEAIGRDKPYSHTQVSDVINARRYNPPMTFLSGVRKLMLEWFDIDDLRAHRWLLGMTDERLRYKGYLDPKRRPAVEKTGDEALTKSHSATSAGDATEPYVLSAA